MVSSLRQITSANNRQTWLGRRLAPASLSILWLAAVLGLAGAGAFIWAGQQLLPLLVAVAIAIGLWLIPGLALLRLLWTGRALGWLERLAMGLGVGIALPPLLLEIAHLIRLPWNAWTTTGYVLVAAAIALYPGQRAQKRLDPRRLRAEARPAFWLAGLSLLTLLQRLYMVRNLVVGQFGDSYQHTMMAQLIVDNQGLFTSWLPYAALSTFTYHFGFHANAALVHWLGGLPVTQSVIVTGQLLSLASVPAAYLLTVRLSRNRTAGIWAALITAFINIQPAYYTNWGRYTQLAGQVILPAVVVAWLQVFERPRLHWKTVLLAALLSACLALTHYIVTIFAALFLAAYVVALILRTPNRATVVRVALGCAAIGALSLVLAAPWLANTLGGFLIRNATGFVNGGVAASRIASYASLPPITAAYVKPYLLGLAVLGWLVALARRQWLLVLLPVWLLLLLLSVIPNVVGLPGAGVIDNFAVYLALYLPFITSAAYALGVAQGWLAQRWPRAVALAAGLAWIGLSAWGFAWQQSNLLSHDFELFTPADAAAVTWIKDNTPATARFFVNTFPAYGGDLIAGTDGGWWLPLLAGRQTNLPPLTYGSERGQVAGYSHQVNTLAAQFRGRPLADLAPVRIDLTTAANHALLLANGFSYVYSGAHSNPGPEAADHIDTQALAARPDWYRLVYNQDGVLIFHIETPP